MANDLDAFMKNIGEDVRVKPAPPAPPTTPDPTPAPGDHKDLDDFMKSIGENVTVKPTAAASEPDDTDGPGTFLSRSAQLGRGIAHGGAILATDLGRLASYVTPQAVSDYVSSSSPGQSIANFADSDYQSMPERIGSYLTQGGAMLIGPGELRLGQLAERAAAKYFPAGERAAFGAKQALNPTAPFKMNPAYNPAQGRIVQGARRAGEAVELGGKGFLGGALADPEHPLTSGALGAATAGLGPATRGLGRAFRTETAKKIGEAAASEGAFYGAHVATGLPYYPLLGPLITWHSLPLNKKLRVAGRYIVDQTGRVIGTIGKRRAAPNRLPGVTGYAAGSARSNLQPTDYGAEEEEQ